VGLDERLEDPACVVGVDARPGVGDRETKPYTVLAGGRGLGVDHDAAALGELHRVAGEIVEDLAQPALVGLHHRRHAADAPGDLDVLVVGARAEQLDHALQQLLDVDRRWVGLDPAGLQLGQVEHVVDQAEQVLAAVADGVDVGALVGVERGLDQQVGHPEHPAQRGPQLMAQRGEEPVPRLVAPAPRALALVPPLHAATLAWAA
jgi:hypothetical protein